MAPTDRAIAGVPVGSLGLGCMNLSHAYGMPPPRPAAAALLRRALELGLTHFDSTEKKFSPLLAESWVNGADGSHRFRIRPNARFHDGTKITVKDILWTLKRQLILKTSTHFPLWEYVLGCEKIRHLDE